MRRPRHLTRRNAEVFEDPEVVACYHHRPPYPEELIRLLGSLVDPAAQRVLEIGCGLGEVARRLAPFVSEATAADPSQAMLDAARLLPGAERVRWVHRATEELGAMPGQGLIVAAESLHWMDWARTFAWARSALSSSGRLAIITGRRVRDAPWQTGIKPLVHEYSTIFDFEAYDLIDRLVEEGLIEVEERRLIGPEPFRQSVTDYLASWHSRSSLSRARLGEEASERFDREVTARVEPFARDGRLDLLAGSGHHPDAGRVLGGPRNTEPEAMRQRGAQRCGDGAEHRRQCGQDEHHVSRNVSHYVSHCAIGRAGHRPDD